VRTGKCYSAPSHLHSFGGLSVSEDPNYLQLATGVTPAERLLNLYETKWQRNVDHVFEHLLY
jgi:gamma-glutamylcysteine synthetase